jgi:hypothetical protein
MSVVINFLNPEDHCVQNNNTPTVVISVKFSLVAGEYKLQMSASFLYRLLDVKLYNFSLSLSLLAAGR